MTPFDNKSTPDIGADYEEKQAQAKALYEAEANIARDAERSLFVSRFARNAMAVVVGLVLTGVLWKMGVLNRGYEKRRITFTSPATGSSQGITVGSKTIYATAGQTIAVNYNATVTRGRFQIWIRQRRFMLGPVVANTGRLTSGIGTLRFTAPRDGWYYISINGSPDGNGYDISYDASWATRSGMTPTTSTLRSVKQAIIGASLPEFPMSAPSR
jgi:hypothetical protein